jgi:hypothetical protein
MILFSAIRLVLLLVIFSRTKVMIMMRLAYVAHMTTIHTLPAMTSVREWSIS